MIGLTLCDTPERHRCPDYPPPAAPALDARAAPAPVPHPAATSESVPGTDAWSPARIPARRRPTLLLSSRAGCEIQTRNPRTDGHSVLRGTTRPTSRYP